MLLANQLSALDAARAIENGKLTCTALVQACLDRIAQRNCELLAFTSMDAAHALKQAGRADKTRGGLLRGIPFAVKDVIETAEYPTSYGSPIYAEHRPRTDAACVSMAYERGAVLLGKVATSEFATQTPSTTRNPLNLKHTPGGSSSGSAAAVADFMVPVAFGTQTTGSIVRPASYCGIVGYKPTFGFFGNAGLKPLSPLQDTIGLLTRTVADAAFFAFGLHGAQLADQLCVRPRLAVCQSKQWEAVSPEMTQEIERLAAGAAREGATVRYVDLPPEFEDLVEIQKRLFAFEARQSLAYERQHHSAQFSARLHERLDGGVGITIEDYLNMRRTVAEARHKVRAMFQDVDALLYPPAQGEADAGLHDSGSAQFGALWSILHLPSVACPMAIGPAGLPLGVQLIGDYGDDKKLLAVAGFVSRVARSHLGAQKSAGIGA